MVNLLITTDQFCGLSLNIPVIMQCEKDEKKHLVCVVDRILLKFSSSNFANISTDLSDLLHISPSLLLLGGNHHFVVIHERGSWAC